MRRLILALAFLPAAAVAGAGTDTHLHVVPRTPEEAARVAAVTAPPTDFSAPEQFEARPGGAATSTKGFDANAFSHSSGNMPFERELDFKVGNGFFRKLWVTAPSSTQVSDGLGPLYNARACQSCHLKDGRAHPPAGPDDPAVGMFLRLSVPAEPGDLRPEIAAIQDYLGTLPDPTYGGQLQTFGIPGHRAEGRMTIAYEDVPVPLADGETVTLRKPTYGIADLAYGPTAPDLMLSPRVAPQMVGLGLLEAIPEADILALEDEDDADGDGISGRANRVWSEADGRVMLGRFGWKAGQPTIREQSASAFSGDIGISTTVLPEGWGECTEAQAACRAAPDGGTAEADGARGPEADDTVLDVVTFYSRNLAVPARRDLDDPDVLRGKRVFHQAGCAACHRPKFVTARLADQPEQSFQLIWPYTDLLLHDMGEGLADHRPEARATGSEWRTAPLWGIGLTETVTGKASFLHDGRARTLLEAVLWHGGEAEAARDTVVALPKADRDALVRFSEFALMRPAPTPADRPLQTAHDATLSELRSPSGKAAAAPPADPSSSWQKYSRRRHLRAAQASAEGAPRSPERSPVAQPERKVNARVESKRNQRLDPLPAREKTPSARPAAARAHPPRRSLSMRLVLALLLALLALPAAAQEIDHAALARRALDDHIRPGFARLAAEAHALDATARAACAAQGPIDLAPLRAAYDATFDAWARIGHLRFGPGEENGTIFGIEFWPDTKGSTPRTLAAMVADENPAVDDPAAFAGQSVAARGLMAIDQLVFDPAAAPLEGGTYPCRLLVAITADLAATADRLVARWDDPWAGILTTAGSDENPVYFTPDEATKALYSALTEGLQMDIDLRLGRPLGTWDKPQPRRAEAWRSGRALPNLVASIEGMRGYVETVFVPAIGPDEAGPVLNSFDAALAAAGRVVAPIEVEVATPQGHIHVEAVQSALRRVQEEVASHVGPTLGVASGFNSMDGD